MTSANKKLKALQESMQAFEEDTGLMRSHKFQVIILPNHPEDPRRVVDFMSVSGLALTAQPQPVLTNNRIVMSRAFRPVDRVLTDWLQTQEELDVLVSAGSRALSSEDKGITFKLHGAKPRRLDYSDLDAGSNALFLEQLTLSVQNITAEHKLFSY